MSNNRSKTLTTKKKHFTITLLLTTLRITIMI